MALTIGGHSYSSYAIDVSMFPKQGPDCACCCVAEAHMPDGHLRRFCVQFPEHGLAAPCGYRSRDVTWAEMSLGRASRWDIWRAGLRDGVRAARSGEELSQTEMEARKTHV